MAMAITQSELTAQGQISVPADVRRKPGLGPGSILGWEEDGGRILVRRSGRFSSQEIHDAVFGCRTLKPHTLAELKDAIRRQMRSRYARC